MKYVGIKIVSLTLALVLLIELCPVLVLADLVSEWEKSYKINEARYQYSSNQADNGENREDGFHWSDSWFFTNGVELNSHLATLSAVAATASSAYCEDDAVVVGHDKNIRAFLNTMGFEDIQTNNYYNGDHLANSAAVAVAHKTIVDKSNRSWVLLAILPMSAGYKGEWAGNFLTGEKGLHEGFKAGCDEILRFVKSYVLANDITGDVKVWISGHSRGGALANLVGAFFAAGGSSYLGKNVKIIPENIYCYTFAASGNVAAPVSNYTLLSVSANRGSDYSADTKGDKYVYPQDSYQEGNKLYKDNVELHGQCFSCLHNYHLGYDLLANLPPSDLGFTVFGVEADFAVEPSAMEKKLESADPIAFTAYEQGLKLTFDNVPSFLGDNMVINLTFSDNSSANDYTWKNLSLLDKEGDLRIRKISGGWQIDLLSPVSNENLTMQQMMQSRLKSLSSITGINGDGRRNYAQSYQNVLSAIFGICGMDLQSFSDSLDSSAIGPLVLNYMAYVSDRLRESDTNLQQEEADAMAITEVLIGLYEYIVEDPIETEQRSTITASGFLDKIANYSIVFGIIQLAGLVPEKLEAAAKDALYDVFNSVYDGDAFMSVISSCVNVGNDEALVNGRKAFYKMIENRLKVKGKDNIDYSDIANVLWNEEEIKSLKDGRSLKEVMLDALKTLSKNHKSNLHKEADIALVELLETARDNAVQGGAGELLLEYYDTLICNPAKLRNLVISFLCRTDGDFNIFGEMRTLVTFLSQINKVFFAHYSEIYLAWMRAMEPEICYLHDNEFEVPILGPVNQTTVTIMNAKSGQIYALAEGNNNPDWDNAIRATMDGELVLDNLKASTNYMVYTCMPYGGNCAISSVFSTPCYILQVNNGSGSGEYSDGSHVNVTANNPETGKRFKEWIGIDDLTFISGGKTKSNASFIMPKKNISITATYEDIPVVIYNINSNDNIDDTIPTNPIDSKNNSDFIVKFKQAELKFMGQARPFTDVLKSDWFYDCIYYCYDKNYFNGISDIRFDPNGNMTRSMLVSVLYRMTGNPKVEGNHFFIDVKEKMWYTDAIIWASQQSIIKGYGNGKFGVDDPITQEQVMTLLWRYSHEPTIENINLSALTDFSQTKNWSKDAIIWAINSKLMDNNDIFDLQKIATRAEIAQFIVNYINKVSIGLD